MKPEWSVLSGTGYADALLLWEGPFLRICCIATFTKSLDRATKKLVIVVMVGLVVLEVVVVVVVVELVVVVAAAKASIFVTTSLQKQTVIPSIEYNYLLFIPPLQY